MKKIFYYSICLFLLLTMTCGCGKESKKSEKASSEVFSLQYQNQNILLDDVFTTEKYGKEQEYSETPSCAFEGVDKTYQYEHYEITTYPSDEKTDKILSIYFLDSEIQTTEGIRLGDTKDQMIQTYGEDYTQEDTLYTYQKDKTQLEFILQDDVIISIEYVLDVD